MTLKPTTATAMQPDDVVVAGLNRDQFILLVQRQGALVVLVLVSLVASFTVNGFADTGNLRQMLVAASLQSLMALGMTFVIITGGIDLSVGSVFALGAVLAAWGAQEGGVLLGVLVPLVVCAAFGAVQGLLIARGRLAPFIVTLAGMLGARGLQQLFSSNGNAVYRVNSAFSSLVDGSLKPLLVVAVIFVLGGVLLARTGFGQSMFAVGGSEQAASLMGLPVLRVKVLVYVLSATLAGASGMLTTARSFPGAAASTGVGYELVAIATVVIGGTLLTGGAGSVFGTAVGVLLLAVIQKLIQLLNLSQSSSLSDVVNGAFLLVVVVIQAVLTRRRQ